MHQEINLYQQQVPARLVVPANTNIKIMLRLPLANIVKLESNLYQQQVPAHLVLPANTNIKIMLRLPLVLIVLLGIIRLHKDLRDVCLVQQESNLSQQQVLAHLVLPASTNIKIMLRLPLVLLVLLGII